jgi:hypothetical protein
MTASVAAHGAEAVPPSQEGSRIERGADRLHQSAESLLNDTIRRVDAFFVSEAYDAFDDSKNRLRLRLDADRIQYAGWDASGKVKLKVGLPGLSQRLRLVVNDGEESDEDEVVEADEDEDYIAARWVAQRGRKTGLNVDAGVRIKGGRLDYSGRLSGRLRYQIGDAWQGQTSNRLYYYTRTGWRNDFRQYFDRLLSEDYFLRIRTRLHYREEKSSNPAIEQKFSVFHAIDERSAIAYEAFWRRQPAEDSPFVGSDPVGLEEEDYDRLGLRVRYRRNVWRPWLFVEAWPGVGWVEERDWDAVLGVRLRLEVNFGRHVGPKLDE